MSDSIFGDLDIASAADDPFAAPVGTWRGTISALKRFTKKDEPDGDKFISLVYLDKESGGRLQEVLGIPNQERDDTATFDRKLSFIKRRFLSLDIPESRMNTVTEDDLIGTDVIITSKKNGDYTNIVSLRLDDGTIVAKAEMAGKAYDAEFDFSTLGNGTLGNG